MFLLIHGGFMLKNRASLKPFKIVYLLKCIPLWLAGLISFAAHAGTPLLGPVNSDPLTQRGISPRILDVAIIPMSQGLRSESTVVYRQVLEDGSSGSERFRMIFDPDTDYGRDLYIELESEPLRSARAYRRILEVTMGADHWLRAEDRIHSASSIKLVSSKDGEDVINFSYSSRRIPTSLQWLTNLTGQVFVVDGVLDRIELKGEGEFQRDGVRHRDYSMTVYFGAVKDHGGHVITAVYEKFTVRLSRQWIASEVWSKTLSYSSEQFGDIAWVDSDLPQLDMRLAGDRTETSVATADVNKDAISTIPVLGEIVDEELHSQDTIRLNLQRRLPFYADDVRKLGFELPKTYGLGIAAHYQSADIDMQGFTVQGIDITGDLPLIDPLGSDLESDILTGPMRADFWVLPFLNVSLLLGEMETQSDVTLRFTPGFQTLVELTKGVELPEFYTFDTTTSGTTAGIGLLTGFQYEQLVMSLGVNYVETITDDTNAELESILWMAVVGYDFGAIGLQALAGIQYLDTDRTIEGSIDLEDGEALEFAIDIGLEETTFLVGFNKDIGRNWTLSSFLGANSTKTSFTANFGYRW
jgi:hypothetical protein